MGVFGGIALVLLIVVVAGVIAYAGDRVGHQVGRKRLTLFGLRPKYTSTIVAVGTGMTIALVATVVPLLTAPLARQAFFHLSEINDKVNKLQAQADELARQKNESSLVINRGQPLYDQFLVLDPAQATPERRKRLAEFFDAVVTSLNRTYVRQGLKPYLGTSGNPEIAKKLDAVLADPRVQGYLLNGPVLLVAVADYNLFVNDRIQFTFEPYLDKRIFASGAPIASLEVDGGTVVNPTLLLSELAQLVQQNAIAADMPYFFANALPTIGRQDLVAMQTSIGSGKGRFYIVAHAASDVFVHTGGIPVTVALSRTER